jgi:hypothetical protein
MGMRVGLVAVIAIAPVRESKFQDLVDLFQKGNRLIDRGNAGSWKLVSDVFVYRFNGGVPFAGGKHPQHG